MDCQTRVELLESFYQARARGESPFAYLHNDVEWVVPGRSQIAGIYRGHDEVRRYMNDRQGLVQGSFTIGVDSISADEDYGLVVATGEAVNHMGRRLRWRAAGVFEFRDDLIARCTLVPLDDVDEFDAFWS